MTANTLIQEIADLLCLGFLELSKLIAYTAELVSAEGSPRCSLSKGDTATTTCRKRRDSSRKTVSFAETLTTIRVPRTETSDRENCWWTSKDISAFRAEATLEVRKFMSHNGIYDGKHALQLMYQPDNIANYTSKAALDILFM